MATVLLIGVGPLPCYRSNTLYGFGIRTWQFLLPLLADGHKVILATLEFGQSGDSPEILYRHDPTLWGGVVHIPMPEPNAENRNDLVTRFGQLLREHKPVCIVSAGSTISSSLACAIPTDLPIWIDLFGDLLAEAQAKAAFAGSEQLWFFHQLYLPILRRGDAFSAVSEAQRFATIGQLGILGRLDHHTLGYNFAHTVPCAYDGTVSPVKQRKVIRGHIVSHNDFVVLCSGGFNTWADIDTLFRGLDGAMTENRRIHVVVTGGAISGHHEEGFNRFSAFIQQSPNRDRFHLVGWVPTEDVDAYILESDLGINADLEITETLFGSRNRFLSWIQAGLPILTTVVCELSQILHREGLCFGVPPSDPDQLKQTLLNAVQREAERRQIAQRARRYGDEHFTFEATTKPLRQWVSSPQIAPDNKARQESGGFLHPLDEQISDWLTGKKPSATGAKPGMRRIASLIRRLLTGETR
ncbi:MAG: glycosyltransferase [bacterium]